MGAAFVVALYRNAILLGPNFLQNAAQLTLNIFKRQISSAKQLN